MLFFQGNTLSLLSNYWKHIQKKGIWTNYYNIFIEESNQMQNSKMQAIYIVIKPKTNFHYL